MDDLIAFFTARLDEGEPSDCCGCFDVNHVPACAPQPWKDRERREIEADRWLLNLYADQVNWLENASPDSDYRAGKISADYHRGAAEAFLEAIKGRAAVWSDHPDYRQEWASCPPR